jgi:hypothetical protein
MPTPTTGIRQSADAREIAEVGVDPEAVEDDRHRWIRQESGREERALAQPQTTPAAPNG